MKVLQLHPHLHPTQSQLAVIHRQKYQIEYAWNC